MILEDEIKSVGLVDQKVESLKLKVLLKEVRGEKEGGEASKSGTGRGTPKSE